MDRNTNYLLIGGGVASASAAQWIRERDADGDILIVCGENHPPYDRPPLSKQFLTKDDYKTDDPYSKLDSFYPDNKIQLVTGVRATGIDRSARSVLLANGDTVRYEKLLLATGSKPRELHVPGSDLRGVFTLRRIEDSEAIRSWLKDAHKVAIIGAGFIGMEVASSALARGCEVTIFERGDYPWHLFASPSTGHFIRQAYESKGVKFALGEEVTEFEGMGELQSVKTGGGLSVAAGLAVVGIGVIPNTELAVNSGLEMGDWNGVKVNEYLQSSDPNIWAAGDIAYFNDLVTGKQWHLEHHLNARYQGRAAGAIMAGEVKPYDQVPYFYSDFLDLHMILRGEPGHWETKVLGDLDGGEYVEVYYDDNNRLRMGLTISHEEPKLDPISDKLNDLIRAKAKVDDLSAGTFGL